MMGAVNIMAVFLGAAAFFGVGAIWYGVLFSKPWQNAAGLTDTQVSGGNMLVIFGLCFAFELLIAVMFGHMLARTAPPPHVIMMMATGFGGTIMAPAIGIVYLFQRKPLSLFLIDAAYFIVGMAAMGGVFIALS